jgi:hypothetical protein
MAGPGRMRTDANSLHPRISGGGGEPTRSSRPLWVCERHNYQYREMTRLALAGILWALAAGSMGCSGPTSPSELPSTLPSTSPAPALPRPSGPAPIGPSGVALFGTVSEQTPTGLRPLEGVLLYCDACGEFGHTFLTTDANGSYRFSGDLAHGGGIWLSDPISVLVQKAGYTVNGGVPINSPSYPEGFWVIVKMNGDTSLDIVLTRR